MRLKESNTINLNEYMLIKRECIDRFNVIPKYSINHLIEYHKNHKYLFMTFSPQKLKALGRLIANKNHDSDYLVYTQYSQELTKLLKIIPTKNNLVNTLLHIFGYFKKNLSFMEKQSFLDDLKKYSKDLIGYKHLVLKLKEYTQKYNQEYLKKQYILK